MSREKTNLYGLDINKIPKSLTQLEIELLYVAISNPMECGGLDRALHIRNVIRILYPFADQNWHEWNDLCLWAWCNYDEIGMTGCASAHKTFTFSLLAFIEWLAKPLQTGVILTSTTIPALRGRIWSEIKRFHNQSIIPLNFNIVDSLQKIQAIKGEDKFAIRGMAVDSGSVEKAVGNIQGNHTERMIIIVDEAAQTPEAIYTARANLKTGTDFFRFVAIANASNQFDAHGKFCEPLGGWSSVSANDESWKTRSGICLHFDGLKSPNVVRKAVVFPRLFAQEDIDDARKNFGEDSLEWWSYVRGFWSPAGIRNSVLDISAIENGKAMEKPLWEGSGYFHFAGLDPAFTTGGDRCILRYARIGNFHDGRLGIEFRDIKIIQLIESNNYPIAYQIADQVIEFCAEKNVPPENFSLDSTGVNGSGASLGDIIAQRWSNKIRRVSFGGKPEDLPISFEDNRDAKTIYENRVTQLWFSVAKLVNAGRVRGLDDASAREFSSRQYELKGEKILLEQKKAMKKRTKQSPDLADCAAVLVDNVLFRLGDLSGDKNRIRNNSQWKNIIQRYNKPKRNYASI